MFLSDNNKIIIGRNLMKKITSRIPCNMINLEIRSKKN
jgi:hypothetical protein